MLIVTLAAVLSGRSSICNGLRLDTPVCPEAVQMDDIMLMIIGSQGSVSDVLPSPLIEPLRPIGLLLKTNKYRERREGSRYCGYQFHPSSICNVIGSEHGACARAVPGCIAMIAVYEIPHLLSAPKILRTFVFCKRTP